MRPDYFDGIAVQCDEGDPWRSTLGLQRYVAWKVENTRRNIIDETIKLSGIDAINTVTDNVIGVLSDDCTTLSVLLRQYPNIQLVCLHLALVRPYCTARAHLDVFNGQMIGEWVERYKSFLDGHSEAMDAVINTEAQRIGEEMLVTTAREFWHDAFDFSRTYGLARTAEIIAASNRRER